MQWQLKKLLCQLFSTWTSSCQWTLQQAPKASIMAPSWGGSRTTEYPGPLWKPNVFEIVHIFSTKTYGQVSVVRTLTNGQQLFQLRVYSCTALVHHFNLDILRALVEYQLLKRLWSLAGNRGPFPHGHEGLVVPLQGRLEIRECIVLCICS